VTGKPGHYRLWACCGRLVVVLIERLAVVDRVFDEFFRDIRHPAGARCRLGRKEDDGNRVWGCQTAAA